MNIIHAFILGIVEGLTEFIPVSSTAHLLISEQLLKIDPSTLRNTFTIAIQLGAILAVVAIFGLKKFFEKETFITLSAGFIPTAVAGVLIYPTIKRLLSDNLLLLAATIGIGGLILLAVDRREKKYPGTKPLDIKGAFILGCFQALALIPGVSRSGGIFAGGLLMRYSRETVVDFSFLLAVPTIAAATVYDLWKMRHTLTGDSITTLLVGAVIAFITAFLTARWFITFTKKNGVAPYGYYRVILAGILLLIVIF